MVPRSGLILLAAAALAVPLLAASPASAATKTSTGVRCTIVGTPGPDHLHGTSHRDVICGLGGTDHIYANGGDDIVDGGTGNDVIYGGHGSDRLLGGSNRDTIYGEAGDDTIDGGTYADRLFGGVGADVIHGGAGNDGLQGDSGNDRLYGEAGRDQVSGSAGADVLYSGPGGGQLNGGDGNDQLHGGDGQDSLYGNDGNDQIWGGNQLDLVHGGNGNDKVWGGNGDDQIYGDAGADTVYGEAGVEMIWGGSDDDHLNGGSGADQIWGGAGADVCRYDIYDWLESCEADKSAPKVISISISPTTVNSDTGDTKVRVRVHATDDLEIARIQGYLTGRYSDGNPTSIYMPNLELVGGGVRDGYWEDIVTLPHWTPSGTLKADIDVSPQYGSGGVSATGGSLAVTSTSPDTETPTISVQSLSTTSMNVRTAAKTVKIAVHGVDAKSGVGRVDICVERPTTLDGQPDYTFVDCQEAVQRTSGTINNGIWTTSLTVPKGSPIGVYNVTVYSEDRIGSAAHWLGPEAYAAWQGLGWCCAETHELAAATSRVKVS